MKIFAIEGIPSRVWYMEKRGNTANQTIYPRVRKAHLYTGATINTVYGVEQALSRY